MLSGMTKHVALYCRISQDKRGRREGVESQERWGRDYAASAWPGLPVEVFADNDLTAADPSVERPEFDRLREWINSGQVAHVWTVEQYRLVRQPIEWFHLAAELDAAGISELHTNRDGVVRAQDEVSAIKAVLGGAEVKRLKQRVNDRLAENAAKGEPAGGVRFGYRRAVDADGKKTFVVVEDQAAIIRECAEKILAGWGLNSLQRDLDGRGLRGPKGGKITASAIQWWLRSPTVAGYRVHRGRIVGDGNWPAILDVDTWQAVNAKLAQPRRVKLANGGAAEITEKAFGGAGAARKYLITSGLSVCGVCGAPLRGQRKKFGQAEPVPYLLCHRNNGGRSCVGIRLEQVQQHVIDTLFAELDKPEFLDQIATDDHADRRDEITRELTALEGRRSDLAALWAKDELGASEWQTARRSLAEHEQALRVELTTIPAPSARVDIATVRQAWPDMTLEEQRELLLMFIERITIHRGTRGSKKLDMNRVQIDWRKR